MRIGTWAAGAAFGIYMVGASSSALAERTQPGETIEITGAVSVPDACEDTWGMGYTEVRDARDEIVGCTCKFGMESDCDIGNGFSWDGGDGPTPPPGSGSGGGQEPDTCERDPEPDACGERTCQDCFNENADCIHELDLQVSACEDFNEKLARNACRRNQRGLSMEQCINYELTGTPGTSTTSSSTQLPNANKKSPNWLRW